MKAALLKLAKNKSLDHAEMTQAMEAIVDGTCPDAQIEEFLLLLRQKKETVAEIAAAAIVMRKHALKLSKRMPGLLDTCGTGGDSRHTINVSTLAALTAAAAGAQVAKHGNRAVSSVCGSADLLEMLGVKVDLPGAAVEDCIEKTGFGFFFAPRFHPATRYAMPARKRIQGKTIFNLLGPLANPAGAQYQLIGVYEERLVETMGQVLQQLGLDRAIVVHGRDGLDEISVCEQSRIAELDRGKLKVYDVQPEQFGFHRAQLPDLQCDSREACKKAALEVLEGKPGSCRDMVCLNAGAALYIAGKAASISEGILLAVNALKDGKAMSKLDEIVSCTGEFE